MDISGEHQHGTLARRRSYGPETFRSSSRRASTLTTICGTDIHHDLFKSRIGANGKVIEEAVKGKELAGDAERIARQKATGYCEFPPRAAAATSHARQTTSSEMTRARAGQENVGEAHSNRNRAPWPLDAPGGSCYGGTPPTEGPNPGCCNTCDDVREAYVRRGWSFVNPDAVEQVRARGHDRYAMGEMDLSADSVAESHAAVCLGGVEGQD